jgi:hypothetical protein
MKTGRARSGKAAVITNSRWLAYATAGASSAFIGSNSTEAAIHYSGLIDRKFKYEETGTFRLDQPGDFIRLIHHTGTNTLGYCYFNVAGKAGASIAGRYTHCPYFTPAWASKLERGQLISNRPFVPTQSALLAIGSGSLTCNGQFAEGGAGYIGFKFNNGSGDQYGWVRIRMPGTFGENFILRDYAYGDVGDHLKAGQTSSNDIGTEEGSLGLLAVGAVGLLAWRTRRSKLRDPQL